MKKIFLLSGLLFAVSIAYSQYNYKFRLTLKDKGTTSYSIDKPEEFLSQKALERRIKQGLTIDSTDIPISQNYIDNIEAIGGKVVAKSKWLNTVAVHCSDSSMVEKYKELPFVSDALFVWRGKPKGEPKANTDSIKNYPANETIVFGSYYGRGIDNIKPNNGQALHNAGFKGKGIDIAVIDAGFNHFPKIEMLDNVEIKGHKGFVYEHEDMFTNANQHGLNVLSCMATNKPMQFVGTAPEAAFWLLGSEDARSEYPIEEDYWAAAIEYADSIGVDVVNTSLGYNNFDFPAKSYTHAVMDGKTAYITRAANAGTSKGLFICISGGNSGDSEWEKITPPADAFHVLTVGAIKRDSVIANFSSRGYTEDLRVKPDVMALGSASIVVGDKGQVTTNSGTSFSSPIMCGMVACLWQALPTLTNKEILNIIRESSDNYEEPNKDYGYGIPDMGKALELGKVLAERKAAQKEAQSKAKPAKDKKKKK